MTSITYEQLKIIIQELIDSRDKIDSKEHSEHHLWIKERIEAEKAFKEMCWSITKWLAQWSIIGIAGFFWNHIYNQFLIIFHHNP